MENLQFPVLKIHRDGGILGDGQCTDIYIAEKNVCTYTCNTGTCNATEINDTRACQHIHINTMLLLCRNVYIYIYIYIYIYFLYMYIYIYRLYIYIYVYLYTCMLMAMCMPVCCPQICHPGIVVAILGLFAFAFAIALSSSRSPTGRVGRVGPS